LGIAFINLVGSSAGFLGQIAIGWLCSSSGHFGSSSDLLAATLGIGAGLILAAGEPPNRPLVESPAQGKASASPLDQDLVFTHA
jgi:hypothetical protein